MSLEVSPINKMPADGAQEYQVLGPSLTCFPVLPEHFFTCCSSEAPHSVSS